MYADNFEFAGEKLSDYGMMICNFDSSGGIETISSGADITFNQIKACGSCNFNIFSSVYDSAYTTTFQICKNSCSLNTGQDMFLSVTEISSLQRWLCRKNEYNRFKIFQEGFEHLYWNAVFSTKQIELNGSVAGLELTLYTDSPFAYMDEVIINKDFSKNADSDSYSFEIYDMSDEEGYIYPDAIITLLENGKDIYEEGKIKHKKAFILKNSLDNKITVIENCCAGEIIEIKGKNQIILSHTHKLAEDFNYFFPRIINTYGENKNTFTCNLKCKIELSYSPVRKAGL